MASNVDIANRALTKIGANRVISIEDDTKEGREVRSMFTIVRDAELRAHDWRFSIKRTSVAALASPPAFGYKFQYRVPADHLKLIQVGEWYPATVMSDYIGAETSEYAFEGNVILTDLGAPLALRYVSRIEDPTLFDALFVEAFACRLAMELAEPITQSSAKRQLAADEYRQAIAAAVRTNAIERPPVMVADDSWIISRL